MKNRDKDHNNAEGRVSPRATTHRHSKDRASAEKGQKEVLTFSTGSDAELFPSPAGIGHEKDSDEGSFSSLDETESGSFDDLWGGVSPDAFAKVMEALPIPALLIDSDLKVIAANCASKRISQGQKDLRGISFLGLVPDRVSHEKIAETLEQVFLTGKSANTEVMLGAEGNEIWGRLTLKRITVRKTVLVIALVEDQTPARMQPQRPEMAAIATLAGGLAHDFNNLMTVITGYCSILTLRMPKDHPQYRQLSSIASAAESATELTGKMLAYSGRQILEVRTLDMIQFLRDRKAVFRSLLGENIELVLSLGSEDARIEADPSQIEQVLRNVAVNARDAMLEGGQFAITVAKMFVDEAYSKPHAQVSPGRYVIIAMADSGTGMDVATCQRVFDPFFTTKDKAIGTGLGLSAAYGIIKQHEGHLTVDSEIGRGTTFRVYLPLVQEEVDLVCEDGGPSAAVGSNETILVVEDDEPVRNFTCEALGMLGYSTLSASCPEDAINLVRAHSAPVDLLLSDVVLPQMDGRRLFETLAPMRPYMKVLYVSGHTEDFIVRRGVLEEGIHFLPKPLSLDLLARKLRQVLDEE